MRYFVVLDSGAIDAVMDTNVMYIPATSDEVTPSTHYWDSDILDFRLKEGMPLVVNGSRITNIPSTGTVEVTGPLDYTGPVVGAELNLVFDLPGVYTVTLTPDGVQWLPTTVVIEVV